MGPFPNRPKNPPINGLIVLEDTGVLNISTFVIFEEVGAVIAQDPAVNYTDLVNAGAALEAGQWYAMKLTYINTATGIKSETSEWFMFEVQA